MKRFLALWALMIVTMTACSPRLDLNRVRGVTGPNAPVVDGERATFSVAAPGAVYVTVAGTFNGWNPRATELSNTGVVWTTTVTLKTGVKYYYKFIIDGYAVADPDNPVTAPDGSGGVYSVLDLRNAGGER